MKAIEFGLASEYFNNFVSDSLEGIQNRNASENQPVHLV